MKEYFVIHCSEDCDISVYQFNKEELVEKLDNNYWGEVKFMDKITDPDPQCWENELLIIKGKIVVPKPKRIIKTYEL